MSAWTKDPGERNIPVGTLGADMTQGSRHTDAQKLDNKLVATGWKILSINKSVDSILDAATRLEQEMAAEAKYWEDILSVKEKDWAISYATQTSQNERLDTRKSDGTLVVRFGFSECESISSKMSKCLSLTLRSCTRISQPWSCNFTEN